jgi:GR25 family glycosyltransferase involved in LPS biosynthesis
MKISNTLPPVHPVCINLKERKSKKKWMIKQCKRMQLKLNFFEASLHQNPKRGCMESHLTVIKDAIKAGHRYLLILEDDAMFIRSLKKLPPAPKNWDMLYLGGTVKHIFARESQEEIMRRGKACWIRMTCWTTHAYIINLGNKDLVKDILKAVECGPEMEIDRYYVDTIHQKYKCYIVNPMVCIQRSGHSDVEGRKVDYSFMEKSILGLRKPPHEIQPDGSYRLKMPNVPVDKLPGVTIITPTRDREWIFSMPLFNFQRFMYPHDKLEWIIVDSSETDDLKHLLPSNDKRIRYFNVKEKEPCAIAWKRNFACAKATHDIIVHMDDDDIYVPETLIARVKPLVGFDGVDCVGCSRIGVYDIINDRSHMASDGHISLSEASMAYKKSFWKEQPFDPGCDRGEYRSFMNGRLQRIMDLPYVFVMIAMNHKRNFTPRTAWLDAHDPGRETVRDANTGRVVNYPDTLDEDTQMFLKNLRTYLLSPSMTEAS